MLFPEPAQPDLQSLCSQAYERLLRHWNYSGRFSKEEFQKRSQRLYQEAQRTAAQQVDLESSLPIIVPCFQGQGLAQALEYCLEKLSQACSEIGIPLANQLQRPLTAVKIFPQSRQDWLLASKEDNVLLWSRALGDGHPIKAWSTICSLSPAFLLSGLETIVAGALYPEKFTKWHQPEIIIPSLCQISQERDFLSLLSLRPMANTLMLRSRPLPSRSKEPVQTRPVVGLSFGFGL